MVRSNNLLSKNNKKNKFWKQWQAPSPRFNSQRRIFPLSSKYPKNKEQILNLSR